jgi:hypothetical protein
MFVLKTDSEQRRSIELRTIPYWFQKAQINPELRSSSIWREVLQLRDGILQWRDV